MPEFVVRIWTSVWTRFFEFCSKVELPRKIWHAGSISLAAWLSVILTGYWIRCGAVALALVVLFIVETLYKKYNYTYLNLIAREAEKNGRRTPVIDFLVAFLFGVIFFPPEALTTALLVVAWCDPSAAFVGQAMGKGRTQWRGSRKSIEGSLACFAVAFMVVLLRDPRSTIWIPLSVGFIAALAELRTKQRPVQSGRFAGQITPADNFWILVSAGTVLSLAQLLTTL